MSDWIIRRYAPHPFGVALRAIVAAARRRKSRYFLARAPTAILTRCFHSFQRAFVANKQDSDTHFFNSFSLVLGILVFIAICLFALARIVGGESQARNVDLDPLHLKKVRANIEPVAHLAVAGQDNTALAKLKASAEAVPAADLPANGEAAYNKICSSCHAAGIAGAPKVGDHAVWGPRIAQGKDTLYKHAIGGYRGDKGLMPAKGGTTWPDELIRSAVDHMLALNK